MPNLQAGGSSGHVDGHDLSSVLFYVEQLPAILPPSRPRTFPGRHLGPTLFMDSPDIHFGDIHPSGRECDIGLVWREDAVLRLGHEQERSAGSPGSQWIRQHVQVAYCAGRTAAEQEKPAVPRPAHGPFVGLAGEQQLFAARLVNRLPIQILPAVRSAVDRIVHGDAAIRRNGPGRLCSGIGSQGTQESPRDVVDPDIRSQSGRRLNVRRQVRAVWSGMDLSGMHRRLEAGGH